MVATSWYYLGDNTAATATQTYSTATTASGETFWFDACVRWERYVEICKEVLKQAENKFRLAIHRKSLFAKKIIPKNQGHKRKQIILQIPPTRNFKCQESRSR